MKSIIVFVCVFSCVTLVAPVLSEPPVPTEFDFKKEFFSAAFNGNEIILVFCIEDKAIDVDSLHTTGMSALMYAAANGQTAIVTELLKRGADIHLRNPNTGFTAIHYAAMKGKHRAISLLARRKAEVNGKGTHGATPLMLAVMDDQLKSVEELVRYQDVLVDEADELGQTPLMVAAARGNRAIVDELLEAGANVNARDLKGKTPLMYALLAQKFEIVELLLDHQDINIDIADNEGATGLCYAAQKSGSQAFERILLRSSSVLVKTVQGKTPLSIALEYGNDEAIGLLASDSRTCFNDEQALLFASRRNRRDIVVRCLDAGTSVQCVTQAGQTPLMWAVGAGLEELAQMLLNHGASVNVTDSTGISPLMIAADRGYENLVSLLIKHHADVNVRDDSGYTALMLAAGAGFEEIVKQLLAAGANKTFVVDETFTAQELAREEGHDTIVELLN